MVSGLDGPGGGWFQTHAVPVDGLDAYSAADPSRPPVTRLQANLPVHLDTVGGGWARVTCSNGWAGFVDARRLVPMTTAVPPAGLRNGPPPAPDHSATAASTPAGPTSTSSSAAGDFIRKLNQPGSGLLAGAVAAGLCIALSWALFPVMGLPGKLAQKFVPTIRCWAHEPGSLQMWVCSAQSGLMVLVGGMIAMLVALFFLGPIAKLISRAAPEGSNVLIGPALGTSSFGLVFASAHDQTGGQVGIVPQRYFPAAIGIAVFVATRYGPALARRFGRALRKRDRMSLPLRVASTAAVPVLLTLLTMSQDRVSSTATKEQAIVLVTMATGYLLLVPEDGDFGQAAHRLIQRLARPFRKPRGRATR